MHFWPGAPYPLGATWDGWGTNFALFSEVADGVDLCLFAGNGTEAETAHTETRVQMTEVDGSSGTPTCRRRTRASATATGCTARIDPAPGTGVTPASCCSTRTARPFEGRSRWHESLFSYRFVAPVPINTPPTVAPGMPTQRGHQPVLRLGERPAAAHAVSRDGDLRGARPGLTLQPSAVPPAQRGTYAGLAPPAIIDHLKSLGVTAVELMPVHQFLPEPQRRCRPGLTETTGATTAIGFFARTTAHTFGRHARPAGYRVQIDGQGAARAGIEVILDVVYNHTAEGNQLGPTLAFRGIDNASLLPAERPDRPGNYYDYTGTGNSLNAGTRSAAADHGLAALLGDRDARRRLPLRPGLRAGPRASRCDRAVRGVLRPGASRTRWSRRSS
jgi:isoamylase